MQLQRLCPAEVCTGVAFGALGTVRAREKQGANEHGVRSARGAVDVSVARSWGHFDAGIPQGAGGGRDESFEPVAHCARRSSMTHSSTPSNDDPLLGTTIAERYRIIRRLGEGGMGVVYEAEHTLIKRRVAIKTLHAQHARNGQIVTRFQREALALTSIGNQHIVEATDMGRLPDGGVFLVLEFLDGRELAEVLKSGPMSVGRAVRIVMQICEALQSAHDKGIVHRDLKPQNVFLIERGGDADFVKVLDFGISKFRDSDGDEGVMTRTGAVIGTPMFMSPEQAQGLKDIDHRADVYAIGVILYRTLAGKLPFAAETFPMLVLKIVQGDSPRLRTYRPDVPDALETLVHRAFAADRDARPASCAELRALLAPFAQIDTPAPHAGSRSQGTGAGSLASLPAASPPESMPAPAPVASVASAAATPSPVARTPDGSHPQPSVDKSNRGPWVIVATALSVCGAGVGTLMFTRDRSHAHGVDVPTTALAVTQPHAPGAAPDAGLNVGNRINAASDAPATAESPARTVHVRIGSNPTGAEVRLDGLPIANPFDGELAYSTDVHRLEATLPGYRTLMQDVTLHLSQSIALNLTRGDGVERHALTGIARTSSPPARNETHAAERATPGVTTALAPAPPAHPASEATPAARPSAPQPEPSHPRAPPPTEPGPPPAPAIRDPI